MAFSSPLFFIFFVVLNFTSTPKLHAGFFDSPPATYRFDPKDPTKSGCFRPNGERANNSLDSNFCESCRSFECCAGNEDVKKTRKILSECNKSLAEYQGPAAGHTMNLRGAVFIGVDLNSINLNGADMEGANLMKANLQSAQLRGANLAGATLEESNLQDAHLEYANLSYARINNTNFHEAHFDHTVFVNTTETNSPLMDRHHKYLIRTPGELCRQAQEIQDKWSKENDFFDKRAFAEIKLGLEHALSSYNRAEKTDAAAGNAQCLSLVQNQKRSDIEGRIRSLAEQCKKEVERVSDGAYSFNSDAFCQSVFDGLVNVTTAGVGTLFMAIPLPGPSEEVKRKVAESHRQRVEQRLKDVLDRCERQRQELITELNGVSQEAQVNNQNRSQTPIGSPGPGPTPGATLRH